MSLNIINYKVVWYCVNLTKLTLLRSSLQSITFPGMKLWCGCCLAGCWFWFFCFCFLVRIYSTVNAFILVERAWSSITEWLVTSITVVPLSHSWAPSVWCIGSIVFKFTSRYDYQRLVFPSNQIAHSGAMKDTQLPCQLRLGFSISCNQHVCAVFSNRVLSFSSDEQPREITSPCIILEGI